MAGQVYAELQRAIFNSASDLSCFRLRFDETWHAVVLGSVPPPKFASEIESLLSKGEATTLPADVVAYLEQRRAQAVNSTLPWIERHYRARRDLEWPGFVGDDDLW